MDAATVEPAEGPRIVRGWMRVASDGTIEGVNAGLAALLGAGGPVGIIGLPASNLVAPGSLGALEAIGREAERERGWRGRIELRHGGGGRLAEAEAEPRLDGFELRLRIPVPDSASDGALPEAPPSATTPHEPSKDAATATLPDTTAPTAPHVGVLLELVGEIAHELGNPLAVIAGYAEGIASLPPEEQRRALEAIEVEAGRAGRVLRALQAFAQSDSAGDSAESPVASLQRLFVGARADRGAAAPPRVLARPSILVVDDEESIRTLTAGVLQAGGYEAVGAASAEEALEFLEGQAFDAVITDIRMPGMSGVALHAEIARRWPELARRVVIVSGDVQTDAVTTLAREFHLPALEKPFRLDALRAALTEVLERDASASEGSGD